MTALVLAEHHAGILSPATRSAITAAHQTGQDIHLVIIGHEITALVQSCTTIEHVTKLLVLDNALYAHALAENIAPVLVGLANNYSHLLTAATSQGKDILPRVAALLGVAQVSDVIKVISPDTFTHPIYAGNALETVQMSDTIKLLTVRATAFDKAGDGANSATIETLSAGTDAKLSTFVSERVTVSARPELTAAPIVVSGGRGVGSKENFTIIEQLADALGAAVGASRAAVDAGYISNDHQVGQTGKVVAPNLYIAVGISGAIQHLAGMKESKVIVAINKDENAPIFDVADYGLVADLFDAIPEIIKSL
jgi:electron transfer flavoprotein alpha subunit